MSDSPAAPETARAAVRLGRHVEWSEGFWLGYVFTIEPPQAHILQARVGEGLAALGRTQRVLRPKTPEELEGVLAAILAGGELGCTWVEAVRDRGADSGEWRQAWIRLTLRANERRELLRDGLAGGLVFVAHPHIKADIRSAGPDLWSIRSLVFELPSGPGVVVRGRREELAISEDPKTRGGSDLELLEQDLLRSRDTLRGVPPELHARSVLRLAERLRSVGRLDEALDLTLEAVWRLRALEEAKPGAFLPDLAGALNNLGICLSSSGRREEALEVTEEAVAIRRTLAKESPDASLRDLAVALANLGNRLSWLGRQEEARSTAQEAVAILRQLANADPDAFLTNLAAALTNLGVHLRSLSRWGEASTVTQEAVEHYAKLAKGNPDALLPDLAWALTNLGGDLSALGRREEAHKATQDAVAILRTLAEENPDAFVPDLARSLGMLAGIQTQGGDYEASLASLSEALRILEPYCRRVPAAFEALFRDLKSELQTTCEAGGLKLPTDLRALLDPPT